jgi:hypothetical protein
MAADSRRRRERARVLAAEGFGTLVWFDSCFFLLAFCERAATQLVMSRARSPGLWAGPWIREDKPSKTHSFFYIIKTHYLFLFKHARAH